MNRSRKIGRKYITCTERPPVECIVKYLKTLFCQQQSGAVEACWAHNPEVRGSKPRSAKHLFIFLIFLICYGCYIVFRIKLELGDPHKILVRNAQEISLSSFGLKQHRMIIKTKPKCLKMFLRTTLQS